MNSLSLTSCLSVFIVSLVSSSGDIGNYYSVVVTMVLARWVDNFLYSLNTKFFRLLVTFWTGLWDISEAKSDRGSGGGFSYSTHGQICS